MECTPGTLDPTFGLGRVGVDYFNSQLFQCPGYLPFIHPVKDGTVMEVWITSTALVNEAGEIYAIATTEWTKELKIDRLMEVHHEKQG